jgi:hypothetical protein
MEEGYDTFKRISWGTVALSLFCTSIPLPKLMKSFSKTDEIACSLSGEGEALDPGDESEKGQNSAEGVARRVGVCSEESSKAPLGIWEGGDEVREGDGSQSIRRIGGQYAGVGPHTSLPRLPRTAGTFSPTKMSQHLMTIPRPLHPSLASHIAVFNLVPWTPDLSIVPTVKPGDSQTRTVQASGRNGGLLRACIGSWRRATMATAKLVKYGRANRMYDRMVASFDAWRLWALSRIEARIR